MTDDPDKPLSELPDLDWDAAIDDWEKSSFGPAALVSSEPSQTRTQAPTNVPSEAERVRPHADHPPLPRPLPPPTPPPARVSGNFGTARGGLGPLFSKAGAGRPSPTPAPAKADPTKRDAPRAVPTNAEAPKTEPTTALPTTALGGPNAPVEPDSVTRQLAALATEEEANDPPATLPEDGEDAALGDAPTLSTRGELTESTGSETVMVARSDPELADAETIDRHPGREPSAAVDDEATTFMRRAPRAETSPEDAASARSREPGSARDAPPESEGPSAFDGEQPGARWLSAESSREFRQRAVWLEEEARALVDPAKNARALLGVSELCALVGDRDKARALAEEARDRAPDVALAWRQARQLTTTPNKDERTTAARIEALEAEAVHCPTPAARAHAILMAADVLRTSGDGDAAIVRWNSASKLDPADVRAPAARAAVALAQGIHTSAGVDLAENSELFALDRAVATALALRGVRRHGVDADPMPINDGLRRARTALSAQDAVSAAHALNDVAAEPTLAQAALWLSAAFGATHIAGRRGSARSLKTLASEGDALARRALVARGIELGDPELVTRAFALDNEAAERALSPATRATVATLAGLETSSVLNALAGAPEYAPLIDALAAIDLPASTEAALARAELCSGRDGHRAETMVGRLLAARADGDEVERCLGRLDAPRSPSADGLAFELAVRAGRWSEISAMIAELPTSDASTVHRDAAAAFVMERAGDGQAARDAWRRSLGSGSAIEPVVRALAEHDETLDLAAALLPVADAARDGVDQAILHVEAATRAARAPGATMDEAARSSILQRAHASAPSLGIAAFLAERDARTKGDVDEVLRWIQERRAVATDPLETALDAVREALLVADRDAQLASDRLEEAHRARPDDLALRELYERLCSEPLTDRGAVRERRAEALRGPSRAAFLTEAALEHERIGDHTAALRCARSAREAGDTGLAPIVEARAEIALGLVERQVEALTQIARDTENGSVRLDAREHLADLLAHGKADADAALAVHESILSDEPAHKPSLRFVEHALLAKGSDVDLERVFEQIARALDGATGGEVTGHAQVAARMKTRPRGDGSTAESPARAWERTAGVAKLAASQPDPSLWALRAHSAHARVGGDDDTVHATSLALLDRTQRPAERASLLVRAGEAASRLGRLTEARELFEQAASEDPADVVTWGLLAELRERAGDARGAAEACESLARASGVPAHQVLAWYEAARLWTEGTPDAERAMTALEHCVELDVAHGDVFQRLSALYAENHLDAELVRLLERRLAVLEHEGERVALRVDLARTLADMGELRKAKESLEAALAIQPDHTTSLAVLAELSAREGDWSGAEQAYVRLARLLATPEEQRAVYEMLGDIYSVHAVNLSRAEVAFREVLKRAPGDVPTLERLVEVYERQGDVSRAVETQQGIVAEASDPAVRLDRLIDLAKMHEVLARDPRRAEQVFESARKEFPTSVVALRAMAEFYARQRQMPAMQILLDRAAGDARRSFAAGRFVTSLFEVLHAAYDLRGRKDGARVVAATLAAVEGKPADLVGADARAADPRLDDLLAPEIVAPALRALFHRAGDSLDAAAPLDLHALRAAPLPPGTPLGTRIASIASAMGLGALQILVSPEMGRVAVPLCSNPPALLVGEGLMRVPNETARAFVIVRALKMILARASFLVRGSAGEVAVLVSSLFTTFNPTFVPQGVDAKRVAEAARRLAPALPRNIEPTVGVIALEAAGTLADRAPLLAPAAHAWANRVALLAVGDPNGALDAIAWTAGEAEAPRGSEERAAWIARNVEARELMTFSVSDAYAEARSHVGLATER